MRKIIVPYIIIFSIVNIIISAIYFKTVTPDSHSYFAISHTLPLIKDSLFPIFYPAIIRLVDLFFSNQVIASKALNIIALLFIIQFFISKKVFIKEFLLIFCLPSVQIILCYSWSENILFVLLSLLIYYNYLFFKDDLSDKKYIAVSTIIYILSFTTKYSAVSILLAEAIFIIYLYLQNSNKVIAMVKTFALSLSATVVYLSVNFYLTGHLTGYRIPATDNNYHLSFYNFIYTFNPFFDRILLGIKLNYQFAFIISFVMMITQTALIIKSKILNETYIKYTLCVSLCFLIITAISYFFTQLNDMNFRLLLPFLILWYFIFFHAIVKLQYRKAYTALFLLLSIVNLLSLMIILNTNIGEFR